MSKFLCDIKESAKKNKAIVFLYELPWNLFVKTRRILRRFIIWFVNIEYFAILINARINNRIVYTKKPISFNMFCDKYNKQYHEIEGVTDREVYIPPYYPDTMGESVYVKSPPIYISELDDAIVIGGQSVVLKDRFVLTDLVENDIYSRNVYCVQKANKRKFTIVGSKSILEMDEAISLLGYASFNYFHLTYEILARYKDAREYAGNADIPVLIDASAKKYKQFTELIGYVIDDSPIVYVEMWQQIKVRRLIYPSLNVWMPFGIKRGGYLFPTDNIVSKRSIENIRSAVKPPQEKNKNRHIFITRRDTTNQRIANHKDLEELFRNSGFEIIDTGRLSFDEQVLLFSEAGIIVGASGAALTNLIYCNKSTVFGCIIPKEYGFYIYSTIAYLVGCKVLFLDADIIEKTSACSMDTYTVSMEECSNYITELIRLSEENNRNE